MPISAAKYLALCLSLAFLIAFAVAAFNYIADPCGIYHFGQSWDWIHNRPTLTDNEFIHKARQVRVAQPDVIFLGNSRVAEGLDPHAASVPAKAYNLALHHSTIYEAWRYLQNACAAHPPQTVVIGVDLAWFYSGLESTNTFSEDRLAVQPDGSPTPWFAFHTADLASTLFSLSTLYSSLQTVLGHTGVPYDAGYAEQAPRVLEQMDRAARVLAANKKWAIDPSQLAYRDAQGRAPQLHAFDHILALCAEKHIHLIVYVHPLHASLIDTFTQDWGAYSDWMKTLATHIESTPGLKAEFWDFSSYNSMNTEAFPAPTDTKSAMHFYWDGFHYHKIVGDMVLQRVFTGTGPAGFGQLITSTTVDQDLARLQAEKQAWHDHGQMVQMPAENTPPPQP